MSPDACPHDGNRKHRNRRGWSTANLPVDSVGTGPHTPFCMDKHRRGLGGFPKLSLPERSPRFGDPEGHFSDLPLTNSVKFSLPTKKEK